MAVIFCSSFATMLVLVVWQVYLVQSLQLTPVQIGQIEGWSILVAYGSKCVAGMSSDWLRRRKGLVVAGTALSVLTKASFVLVSGFMSALVVVILDRLAKGLRSSPADAMIGDTGSKRSSRLFYYLKQTAMLSGNVAGAFAARNLLKINILPLQGLFAIAVIPCLLAYLCSRKGLKEEEPSQEESAACSATTNGPFFSREYVQLVLVSFVIMFERFGTTFASKRAFEVGIFREDWPLLMVLYEGCAASIAFLCGVLTSRMRQETKKTEWKCLQLGLVCHCVAHGLIALAPTKGWMWPALILSGGHLGLSQGALLGLIAQSVPKERRATAFAFNYLVAGIGGFVSNHVAGFLCQACHSSSGAFWGGCVFSAVTLCTVWYLSKKDLSKKG